MKTILVTGGAGYIGSHVVRQLEKNNYRVIVFDNLSKGYKDFVKNSDLYIGDLANIDDIKKAFNNYNIDSVIHLAAESLVGESMTNPKKYYENNIMNGINLLNTMLEFNVNKIVFSSTAAVYGEPQYVPIDENHPTNPTNVYGRTKLYFENILSDYDKAYGVKYISLRYFNAAGADEEGDIGEKHEPETHLIPLVLDVAYGKRENIHIFGDDYATDDGTAIRDYIHVNDLASAHVLALESLLGGNGSSIYNLGSERGFSVRELIEIAKEVTNTNIPSVISSRREGDPAILIASSEKVKKELGWRPKYEDINIIIQSVWNWVNFNVYNSKSKF